MAKDAPPSPGSGIAVFLIERASYCLALRPIKYNIDIPEIVSGENRYGPLAERSALCTGVGVPCIILLFFTLNFFSIFFIEKNPIALTT